MGREKIGGAVAFVVMGQIRPSRPASWAGGGSGAIEGLDLGLLVETEDDSPLGRVEIEPDDIDQLLLE